MLRQIGQTIEPNRLLALVQAIGALPVTFADAQAQQALAPVLQQIVRTDAVPNAVPNAVTALAQAIRTLAPRLSETTAQQAFAVVLQEIGRTDDEYSERHLRRRSKR